MAGQSAKPPVSGWVLNVVVLIASAAVPGLGLATLLGSDVPWHVSGCTLSFSAVTVSYAFGRPLAGLRVLSQWFRK